VQKISPPPGFDPRTVQPVPSRYTDYAIAARLLLFFFKSQPESKSLLFKPAFYPLSNLAAKRSTVFFIIPFL
jgi:hypothetical protein